MPYMFRAKEVGKLVGTTTFGILVGNAGAWLNGRRIYHRAKYWHLRCGRKWIIEQEGWLPMWQWKTTRKTCSMAAMHSWKAIELILKDLKPHKEVNQPADPIRVADY